MHRLADLATLYDQRRLHALAHIDQIVVHGAHSQQRRDVGLSPVLSPIREGG